MSRETGIWLFLVAFWGMGIASLVWNGLTNRSGTSRRESWEVLQIFLGFATIALLATQGPFVFGALFGDSGAQTFRVLLLGAVAVPMVGAFLWLLARQRG